MIFIPALLLLTAAQLQAGVPYVETARQRILTIHHRLCCMRLLQIGFAAEKIKIIIIVLPQRTHAC
ncbi:MULTISPECIES: hypothetical protein [Rhizobium/Agrobacterium group]|uniref:hypothetical protein n=1 Tax=Rhizobium/Agrobacterium group TaxID=227290 RepID=UPI001572C5D5|nr:MULTISPECIES: hypothetical protein [Rhizobium/Agrobacterium group]NSZ16156.1 hypothetical protein [Agrobacterium vitis]QZO04925.1 hypothetical protein K4831_05155 [Agrobacterium vitis]UJL87072.1 hypothetical protein AVF2S5_03495 [Agrobacterium vitis]